MIVEQRTYVLKLPFGPADYLAAYERLGLESQMRILGRLLGYFAAEVGELNSVTHLWGFDSFEDRLRRRSELSADPSWCECLEAIRPMIQSMRSQILLPTTFSPIR